MAYQRMEHTKSCSKSNSLIDEFIEVLQTNWTSCLKVAFLGVIVFLTVAALLAGILIGNSGFGFAIAGKAYLIFTIAGIVSTYFAYRSGRKRTGKNIGGIASIILTFLLLGAIIFLRAL